MGASERTDAEASAPPPAPRESSAFDRSVAVEPIVDGGYGATVDPRWNIANAPNGGYLLSIALSAVATELPHPDPFAVSAHYPSRTEPGPAEVSVEVVRLGRGSSTARAILSQGGTARALVTATYGDLDAMHGPTSIQTERPD